VTPKTFEFDKPFKVENWLNFNKLLLDSIKVEFSEAGFNFLFVNFSEDNAVVLIARHSQKRQGVRKLLLFIDLILFKTKSKK